MPANGNGDSHSVDGSICIGNGRACCSSENMRTSAGIVFHVDGDRRRVIDDDKALVAVAADACALCCLQCTGALVLILYLVQIGLWSWAFHQVYAGLPQTFAWEKLLRSYGSHYDDCIDRNGETEIELKSPALCPNVYTMPCVPILAIVILLLNLFSGTSCLSKPKSRRMYTMVTSSTTWQFVFTVVSLVFVSLYFHADEARLETTMRRELGKGIPETPRWQLTQIIHKCCGIRNYTDWEAAVGWNNSSVNSSSASAVGNTSTSVTYPSSCFENQHREGFRVQKEPCYGIEHSIVRFWAIFEIGLLCAGLVTTVFFLCLATAVHGGARGKWKEDRCVGSDSDNAGLYFVRAPHHRHHYFHHEHERHHAVHDAHAHQYNVSEAESSGFSTHQDTSFINPRGSQLSPPLQASNLG